MLVSAIFNTHRAKCTFVIVTVNVNSILSIRCFKSPTPSPNKRSKSQPPRLDLEPLPLVHPQFWTGRMGIVAAVMHRAAMEMTVCLPMSVCRDITMTTRDTMVWQQIAMAKLGMMKTVAVVVCLGQ